MKTPKQEAIERYIAGESSTTLAEHYGVHYGTILSWVRKAGFDVRAKHAEGPVMTEAVKAEVDKLQKSGLSGAEIARKLGINRTLVYRRHSFAKDKPTPIPTLNGAERRTLNALLEKLEAFLRTERGKEQSAVIRPQVRVLKKVLKP